MLRTTLEILNGLLKVNLQDTRQYFYAIWRNKDLNKVNTWAIIKARINLTVFCKLYFFLYSWKLMHLVELLANFFVHVI